MFDRFDRQINYLRISVTDRCNLRCTYCMPADGITLLRHEDILSYDEIVEVAQIAAEMGVSKIRLTGGEPLVRKGITNLVKMLASIPGIVDLSMTTNGILLERFAQELKDAGLQRVNISFDTLDAERFRKITRGGDIEEVKKGIMKAREVGLTPVKINCVTGYEMDPEDAARVKEFSEANGFQVRFIRQMDLASGEFYVVDGGDGGNCNRCNRLRLTSNGIVKPCLFNAIGYNVRELGAREAILQAVSNKPRCGTANSEEEFSWIGG
ncbi:MAG TPA: radical SAM protein [Bacteroidales bacterium]|nr:radical SAM protein [Bacteroidales bacterium]